MFETAMIHGRFQPFHNGHFEYLKDALKVSKQLFVGITNPDPSTIVKVDSDSHRHNLSDNPFSFYVRLLMIKQSILSDKEIKSRYNDIIIVPFPVNKPELWEYYIPKKKIIQIMRILESWDLEKEKMFRKYGFEVYNLPGERRISGTEIRIDLKEGNNKWYEKVPEGTYKVMNYWLSNELI